MTLEEQLDALCQKHNLESISVTRQTSGVRTDEYFTCVSARGKDGNYETTTLGTVGEQLAYCVSSITARRAVGKSLADLVGAA